MLRTAKEAVSVLGGPTHVAKHLRLDQSTVSGWTSRGEVARGWEMDIYFSLRAMGYERKQMSPRIFGYENWNQVGIPPAAKRKT